MSDDLFASANKWAMGTVEEDFAEQLAERARSLGLDSTASIRLDDSEVPMLGDESINLDRVRALADARLAEDTE